MALPAVASSEQTRLPRKLVKSPLAFDQGGSLLKVVFVDKDDNAGDFVTLHARIYRIDQLEEALAFVKERCRLEPDELLNITGVGYWQIYERVEKILSVRTTYRDELTCQTLGALSLIQHTQEAFWPAPTVHHSRKAPQMVVQASRARAAQKMTANDHDDDVVLPANFLIIGSAPVVVHVDKEGKAHAISMIMLGGLSFMGLARLLLGTADHHEVMALAAAGTLAGLDTQLKDTIGTDSAYGSYDSDLAYLPFGKLFMGLPSAEARREDIAASLLNVFSQIAFQRAVQAARVTGISRFYVGGNWVQSEVARKFLSQQWSIHVEDGLLKFKFLKGGFTGALGAILTEKEKEGEE